MSAPDILAAIKDDLGICDVAHDAWVQRRIDAVWSRIETWTARKLCCPPQSFTDDWTRVAVTNLHQPLPPPLYYQPRSSVFLRYFPVTEIVAVDLDGTPGIASNVRFNPRTGKLFSLTGPYAEDVSATMWRSRVTYKAGWTEIPGDLYEVVLGSIQTQWSGRASAMAGAPAGSLITAVTVADVGSLEVSSGGNAFQQATMKGVGTSDPLLGPYLSMLEPYVDHRSLIGHALMPVTEPEPEPVP